MSDDKPIYPALDRAAFLIERACVPKYIPPFHAEAAQILAALEAARQSRPTVDDSG